MAKFERLSKGNNWNIKLDGNKLTISIDLATEIGLSASEKNMMLSTTRGNHTLNELLDDIIPDMGDITLGINCYRKVKK